MYSLGLYHSDAKFLKNLCWSCPLLFMVAVLKCCFEIKASFTILNNIAAMNCTKYFSIVAIHGDNFGFFGIIHFMPNSHS